MINKWRREEQHFLTGEFQLTNIEGKREIKNNHYIDTTVVIASGAGPRE